MFIANEEGEQNTSVRTYRASIVSCVILYSSVPSSNPLHAIQTWSGKLSMV